MNSESEAQLASDSLGREWPGPLKINLSEDQDVMIATFVSLFDIYRAFACSFFFCFLN